MPQYNYSCPKCNHQEQVTHSISECDNEHICPECGSNEYHRVPQLVAVHLLGLGWASTGYQKVTQETYNDIQNGTF